MSTITVVLTQEELRNAAHTAIERRLRSMFRGDIDNTKSRHQKWDNEIEGAFGETAFCKALGFPLELTIDTFKAPDVQGMYHLRTTTDPTGRLIIRPGDRHGIYVLVRSAEPIFYVCGWFNYTGQLKAGEGADWWRDDAWWLPVGMPLEDIYKIPRPSHERKG